MTVKQHTIQKQVELSGVGLHTGVVSNLTFLPAAPNHGIKFQRIDLEGRPTVDADCDLVVDVSRGTTLEQNGARVYTVEHVLAALVSMEIDNVLIQLDGPEPPIMDGSSIQFIEVLEDAGLQEQNALRRFFEVQETIQYKDWTVSKQQKNLIDNEIKLIGVPRGLMCKGYWPTQPGKLQATRMLMTEWGKVMFQ